MKFSCEKETLLNLLNIASRAVTGKSSMPLLEGLLLAADADILTITGYDLSMGIRTTAQVDVVEPGRIVLNSRLFCEIVRKLPQDVVYLETDDKLMTTIKCGRSVFNLMASEADEYPALADVASDKGLSLPQPILKSMIAQTIFSVSDNESKPIHTGCLFEIEGSRLNVVAVDGYRLSVRRETVEGVPGDMKFVVPGASLREIERILGDDDDIVEEHFVPHRRHDSHYPSDRRRVSQLPCGHSEGVRARGFGGSPGADPVHRACLPDRVGKAEKPDPLPF